MKIGKSDLNKKVLIIAELSANHNQNINLAKETIKAAKEAGADAIKLQTYTPDASTLNCSKEDFIIKDSTLWNGKTLYELYKTAYTPWEWHKELFDFAKRQNIMCFSTPANKEAVDFLEKFNPIAYKIASFEITDYELIRYSASKKRPIIISTGIATIDEILDVVEICKNEGNEDIVLLKCTSSYPAPLEDANLKTIANMKETFGIEVGFSDHTLGITAPIVAVTFGARVVEKHFILDKNIDSPDNKFSLDKNEFKEMVKTIREAEKLIGTVDYSINEKKKKNRMFARSLYIVKDVKKGEVITNENIKSIRPGFGLHPKYLKEILGKKFRKNLEKGTALKWEHFK